MENFQKNMEKLHINPEMACMNLQKEVGTVIQICSKLNSELDALEKQFDRMERRPTLPARVKKRKITDETDHDLLVEIRDLLKMLVSNM